MNEIEQRFYDTFDDICNQKYIIQASKNKIKVEMELIKESKDKDSISLDIIIKTFLDNVLQFTRKENATLYTQYQINGGFVVDFLLELFYPSIKLAIEIDGHDFHEKTKEQAYRDKSRDRYLLKEGIPVIHYTGTEVFTKTDECIKESLNIFANIYKNILGSNEETYYSYLIKEE